MDAYLRDRAEKLGAKVINGLMMKMEQPGQYTVVCLFAAVHHCCNNAWVVLLACPEHLLGSVCWLLLQRGVRASCCGCAVYTGTVLRCS